MPSNVKLIIDPARPASGQSARTARSAREVAAGFIQSLQNARQRTRGDHNGSSDQARQSHQLSPSSAEKKTAGTHHRSANSDANQVHSSNNRSNQSAHKDTASSPPEASESSSETSSPHETEDADVTRADDHPSESDKTSKTSDPSAAASDPSLAAAVINPAAAQPQQSQSGNRPAGSETNLPAVEADSSQKTNAEAKKGTQAAIARSGISRPAANDAASESAHSKLADANGKNAILQAVGAATASPPDTAKSTGTPLDGKPQPIGLGQAIFGPGRPEAEGHHSDGSSDGQQDSSASADPAAAKAAQAAADLAGAAANLQNTAGQPSLDPDKSKSRSDSPDSTIRLLSDVRPNVPQPGDSSRLASVKIPPPTPSDAHFAEANHPNIVSTIHGQLLPRGGTMHIRLDPPELGAMQVSVHMKDGVMTASFNTSNDEATRLLSHSLHDLKNLLESGGVQVDKLQVRQQAAKDFQHHGGEDPSARQQAQDQSAHQEQQRREMVRRMWARLGIGHDPLDITG